MKLITQIIKMNNSRSLRLNKYDSTSLVIFFLLITIGAVLLLGSGSELVFYIGVFSIALITACAFFLAALDVRRATLFYMFGVMNLVFYALGTASTVIGLFEYKLTIFDISAVRVDGLCIGLAQSAICSGILFFISSFIKSPFYMSVPVNGFNFRSEDLRFPALVVILNLWFLASGGIAVQGIVADSQAGGISALTSIFVGLLVPSLVLCLVGLFYGGGLLRAGFSLLSLIIMALLAISGRRNLIFGVTTAMFFILAMSNGFRGLSRNNIIVGLVAGVFVVLGYRSFYALRLAGWALGENSNIYDVMTYAFDIMIDSDRYGFGAELRENEIYRTFVLEYHSLISDRIGSIGAMWGNLFGFNLLLNIPSLFYSGKSVVIALGADEEILHPYLGLPVWDGPNSLMTSGMADFGWLGAIMYPVLFISIFYMVTKFLRRIIDWRSLLLVCAAMLNQVLQVESSMSTYFSVIRDIWIYLLLFIIFNKFFGVRSTGVNFRI